MSNLVLKNLQTTIVKDKNPQHDLIVDFDTFYYTVGPRNIILQGPDVICEYALIPVSGNPVPAHHREQLLITIDWTSTPLQTTTIRVLYVDNDNNLVFSETAAMSKEEKDVIRTSKDPD